MKKDNIAVYTKVFLPVSETFTYERVIFSKRYEPTVICEKKENENIFPFKNVHSYSAEKGLFQPKKAFYESILMKNNVKLIVAQHSLNGMDMLPVAKKLGLPLITFFHGSDVFAYKDIGFKIRLRSLFNKGAAFIVNCEYMKNELVKMGCPAGKLRKSYSGINLDKFKIKNNMTRNENFNILMCGRLVEVKGHIYGIKAYEMVRARHPGARIKLTIIGDGPLEKELKDHSKNIPGIDFLGALDQRLVAKEYQKADAVVVPSIHTKAGNPDAIPVVAREAMATMLPVIATNIAGMPEVIKDGYNGFLVPEKSPEEIAEKLEYIINYPDKALDIARNARRTIEENFDLRRKIDEMEDIFAEFIK